MHLKYIYNEAGEKEAVIIPIREWEELTGTPVEPPVKTVDPSIYYGALAHRREELLAYLETLRSEWG